jgi:hypothetical protein
MTESPGDLSKLLRRLAMDARMSHVHRLARRLDLRCALVGQRRFIVPSSTEDLFGSHAAAFDAFSAAV